MSTYVPPILRTLLRWLRAGYPTGLPGGDYVALLGVLHRKLTDTEVQQIVTRLTTGKTVNADTQPITHDQIAAAIAQLVKEKAGADDIARVESRLAADGWPPAKLAES